MVNKIFSGATDSVDLINDKVIGEINDLFSDQDSYLVVKLGADRKAKIKRGTTDFGVAIGAQNPTGNRVDRSTLEYKLILDNTEQDNCIVRLRGVYPVKDLIQQRTETWLSFDSFDGSDAFARIAFDIPKAITKCSQKILIDVRDENDEVFAGTFFKIEIV